VYVDLTTVSRQGGLAGGRIRTGILQRLEARFALVKLCGSSARWVDRTLLRPCWSRNPDMRNKPDAPTNGNTMITNKPSVQSAPRIATSYAPFRVFKRNNSQLWGVVAASGAIVHEADYTRHIAEALVRAHLAAPADQPLSPDAAVKAVQPLIDAETDQINAAAEQAKAAEAKDKAAQTQATATMTPLLETRPVDADTGKEVPEKLDGFVLFDENSGAVLQVSDAGDVFWSCDVPNPSACRIYATEGNANKGIGAIVRAKSTDRKIVVMPLADMLDRLTDPKRAAPTAAAEPAAPKQPCGDTSADPVVAMLPSNPAELVELMTIPDIVTAVTKCRATAAAYKASLNTLRTLLSRVRVKKHKE
jgi:hypothetical protein